MDQGLARRHAVARLLAGLPQLTYGRLLADTTRAGDLVPLDPSTGGELAPQDDRPAFILSTEKECTDGNILRQHWDLGRAAPGGVGMPVLWQHNPDILLGTWQDVAVANVDGPVLVGRAFFDPEDEAAQMRRRQIKAGILRGVSIRWIPGAQMRRGTLDPKDPSYRAPVSDECGQPEEGFVMGSAEQPNVALEASLITIGADPNAYVTERLHARAAGGLKRLADSDADLDATLAVLAGNPRVQGWFERQFDRISAARAAGNSPSATADLTLGTLFGASK